MTGQSVTDEGAGPAEGPRSLRLGARLRRLLPGSKRGRIVLAVAVWYLLSFVVLRDGIRYAVFARELGTVNPDDVAVCYLHVERERDPSSLLLDALSDGAVPVQRASKMPPRRREDDDAVVTPSGEPGLLLSVDRIVPVLPFVAIADSWTISASLAGRRDRHIVIGITPFWVVVHSRVTAVS
jgi:hypothetical protein